jgi:hypothetical protein
MLTEGDAVLSNPKAGKGARKGKVKRGKAVRPIVGALKAAGIKKPPKKGFFV